MNFYSVLIVLFLPAIYLLVAFRTGLKKSKVWFVGSQTFVLISVLFYVATAIRANLVFQYGYGQSDLLTNILFGFSTSFFIGQLVMVVVLLLEDFTRLSKAITHKIKVQSKKQPASFNSRRQFVAQGAFVLGAIPFAGLARGTTVGKYRQKVFSEVIASNKIPACFDGFKIVQISDIHAGSFDNYDKVAEAVAIIQEQQPDLIVCTGDWVNNHANEIIVYKSLFAALEAPYGKYTVWGNHDYTNTFDSRENIAQLQVHMNEIGFDVLNNRNISIDKQGEAFNLIGVENWGHAPFPQFGDLDAATQQADPSLFSILLSHDPTHWDEQAVKHSFPFDLTLSGHTHGAQMGVEGKWLRWSPVQYVYKHWAGMYQNGLQKLYVNRGFGFIGYPGRAGISAEITSFELKSLG